MANKANKMVLGYVFDFMTITEADAKKLTHINVAFGNLTDDQGIDLAGSMTEVPHIRQVRRWNPDIKIILSMGTRCKDAWVLASSTEEGRRRFAETIANVMVEREFDGIDLDWEYPCVPSNNISSSPEDKVNFTLMLKAIRERLDQIPGGKHYYLTIAAGADVYYCENVEMDKITPLLDWINVMTYDLKCGFHALSGHHCNLYASVGDYFRNSCDQALRLFESYGVPKDKLLMGAAFYSRKWTDVPNVNNGFLQLTKNGGGYGPDYHFLLQSYINKNGYTRYWDDVAKAPWLYNPEEKVFLSYDDPESLAAKCEYIIENDYAGIFYWNHISDNTRILLDAIIEGFNK